MSGALSPNAAAFRIAEIGVSVSSEIPWRRLILEDHYNPFRSDEPPDIEVRASYSLIPDVSLLDRDLAFDATRYFKMYARNGARIMALGTDRPDIPIFCLASFDEAYAKGDVFFSREYLQQTFGDLFPHPLLHPLFRTLIGARLALGRGLLVHACGIDAGGKGFLFSAGSTRGKTTMARLWESAGAGTVLNDERVILTERAGRFWIYGTPWHGELPRVSPRGVPLEKIFFLDHAPSNALRRRSGAAAATALLSHSYQPVWDRSGLEFTLEFSRRVATGVPCYDLGYVPDASVLDFIRCAD